MASRFYKGFIVHQIKYLKVFFIAWSFIFCHVSSAVCIPYETSKQCDRRYKICTWHSFLQERVKKNKKLNRCFTPNELNEVIFSVDKQNQQKNQTEAQDNCNLCEDKSHNNQNPELTVLSGITECYSDKKRKDGDIHPACFFASSLRGEYGKNHKNYICDKPDLVNPARGSVKPCFNKKYTELTKKSFDYIANCFNYNAYQKKELFKLFNHESGFSLNNKSGSSARCYGQIAADAFKEVGKHIYRALNKQYFRGGTKQSYMYEDALEKCPNLTKKAGVIPFISAPKKSKREAQKHKKTIDWVFNPRNPQARFNALPMTCSLITNPYNCFLYSMFNVKINSGHLNKRLNQQVIDIVTDRTTHHKVPLAKLPVLQKISNDFQFPVYRHEVLIFKGVVKHKKDKRVSNQTWVFENEKVAYQTMQKYDYDSTKSDIRKVPMFKSSEKGLDREIKTTILNTAYNGGVSVVLPSKHYFVQFLLKKSQDIARRCSKKNTTKRCKQRRKILSGESLSVKDFKTEFQRYMRSNYDNNDPVRRSEVANFQSKVEEDSENLAKIPDSAMETNLNEMHPSCKTKDQKNCVHSEQKKKFLEFVKNNCP